MQLRYTVPGGSLQHAGEASSQFKNVLKKLGIHAEIVRRTAVAMYEAEINMVIHAGGGTVQAEITPETVAVILTDSGPGIPDIELAMQEGYSTATDEIRAMGFGAGMGLPNIRRYSDVLEIASEPGKGTTVKIIMFLNKGQC